MEAYCAIGRDSAVRGGLCAHAGPASEDCGYLEQAVEMSADEDVQILKVRSRVVVTDIQTTYTLPTGTAEAVLFSCKGTAARSRGDSK